MEPATLKNILKNMVKILILQKITRLNVASWPDFPGPRPSGTQ